jgi:hypothetical protein
MRDSHEAVVIFGSEDAACAAAAQTVGEFSLGNFNCMVTYMGSKQRPSVPTRQQASTSRPESSAPAANSTESAAGYEYDPKTGYYFHQATGEKHYRVPSSRSVCARARALQLNLHILWLKPAVVQTMSTRVEDLTSIVWILPLLMLPYECQAITTTRTASTIGIRKPRNGTIKTALATLYRHRAVLATTMKSAGKSAKWHSSSLLVPKSRFRKQQRAIGTYMPRCFC